MNEWMAWEASSLQWQSANCLGGTVVRSIANAGVYHTPGGVQLLAEWFGSVSALTISRTP